MQLREAGRTGPQNTSCSSAHARRRASPFALLRTERRKRDSATAVAAAAQRVAASREQTGVLNGLARIAELDASPTGLASLTRELDARGARLPDLVRLVSADAASISNLASTMAADSQFIADVRAIRGACLRRVELLIKGGDLTVRWSDRERKHTDRIRCGRFSKVDFYASSRVEVRRGPLQRSSRRSS